MNHQARQFDNTKGILRRLTTKKELINKPVFFFCLTSGVLLFVNSVQAKIYKCKGREGVVNFTSIPCGKQGVEIKPVKKIVRLNADGSIKTNKQIIADRLKKEKIFLDARKKKRDKEEKKRAKYELEQQKIKSRCKQAKSRLRGMYRSNLFAYRNGRGTNYSNTDIDNGESAVLELCGKKF